MGIEVMINGVHLRKEDCINPWSILSMWVVGLIVTWHALSATIMLSVYDLPSVVTPEGFIDAFI